MADVIAPTAVIVAPADMKLADLTRVIKDNVAKITGTLRNSVMYAIETGALLNEAKARVGHGNFERWVESNCNLSIRTARRWMTLADKRAELEKVATVKSVNLAELNVSSARRLIEGPKKTNGTPTKTDAEKYQDAQNELLACLKKLGTDAESCAKGTVDALTRTLNDLKDVPKP